MKRMMKYLTGVSIVFVFLILALTLSMFAQEHVSDHWGYNGAVGPSHWAELNPQFAVCGSGHHQSPIDIRNARKADLPAIQVDYKPSPLHIIDNGHTIMINYAPGSFIRVGEKQYALKQFHFHRRARSASTAKLTTCRCTWCMLTSKEMWP